MLLCIRMIRLFEIACTSMLVVLFAPLLIPTWLWLVVNRVHPVLVNAANPLPKPESLTRFNASGDDRISRWIHRFSIDLLPCLFNVIAGSARLRDIYRSCLQIGELRDDHDPQHSKAGDVRLAVLLAVAFLALLLAFCCIGWT